MTHRVNLLPQLTGRVALTTASKPAVMFTQMINVSATTLNVMLQLLQQLALLIIQYIDLLFSYSKETRKDSTCSVYYLYTRLPVHTQ